MQRFVLIAAVGLLALSAPAAAQPTTQSEELVVTGERLHELVRGFIEELQPPPLSENQMARWDSRICPLVAGIPERQAQFVIDRISQRAFDLGLRPGAAGCRANVLIFVTPDADVLAQALADDRALVAYYNNAEYGNTPGREALAGFVASDAPVRWWHVAQTVSRSGVVLDGEGDVVGSDGTRLRAATRQDFNRAMIIVDARQADGLSFGALADYLAMVTLAQLEAGADTSQTPSILNLFTERAAGIEPTAQMTQWDLAYLEGLYAAPRQAPNVHTQQRAISRRMEDELLRGSAQ
jgi:hypothetical protein